MAAGWVLKGSIVRSEKIRKLYSLGLLDPIRVYCFLRATADNWGMMPADKWTLKAELGPEDNHHNPDDYAAAVLKLEAVGLVQTWEDQGSPWLYVVGHEEANGGYLKRRTGNPRVKRPATITLEDAGGNKKQGRVRGGDRKKKTTPYRLVESMILDHATVFNHNQDLIKKHPPTGDLRKRIMKAIDEYGVEVCRQAHRGHKKQCVENPKRGKELRFCYQPLDAGGKPASDRLDSQKFQECIEAGGEMDWANQPI
jgi:hypothetical protein